MPGSGSGQNKAAPFSGQQGPGRPCIRVLSGTEGQPGGQARGAVEVSSVATIYVASPRSTSHVSIGPVPDCLFCGIVTGEVPAERVLETERTLAFRDINPQTPIHVLVIPKPHYPDLAGLAAADAALLAEVAALAHEVALREGIAETGYRVVFNTGSQAGQTVDHAHAHVIGGRLMAWPPG